MKRTIGLCLLMLSFLLSQGIADAQKANSQEKESVISPQERSQTDERLLRPLSLEATGIALADLLHSMSDKTIEFQTEPDCKEMRLQLRLRSRPLHAVMEALAELLPGQWIEQGNGKGYLLKMTKEARAKRDTWWKLYEDENKRGLQEINTAILKAMRAKKPPNSSQDYSAFPAHIADMLRMNRSNQMFSGMDAALQEEIAHQILDLDLKQYVDTTTGVKPLLLRVRDLPGASQEVIKTMVSGFTAEQGSGAFVSF